MTNNFDNQKQQVSQLIKTRIKEKKRNFERDATTNPCHCSSHARRRRKTFLTDKPAGAGWCNT